MTVSDIQEAIAKLPESEFHALQQWISEEYNRRWDTQIEADSASGALDPLLKEVDAEL